MVMMELAEVVNPHFAVPVVGVVLCALLVYAFGFKSPVQPPSFDFVDSSDERKKKPKKPKKAPTNGHVVTVDSHVGAVGKHTTAPKSPGNKQASTDQPKSSNSMDKPGDLQKTPKPKRVMKQSVKPGADSNVVKQKPDEAEDGEWTTMVSRKDKKNRNKKEEGRRDDVISDQERDEDAAPASVPVATPSPPVSASPLGQRQSKKDKKKREPTPENVQSDSSDKENAPEDVDQEVSKIEENKGEEEKDEEKTTEEEKAVEDEKPATKPATPKKKKKGGVEPTPLQMEQQELEDAVMVGDAPASPVLEGDKEDMEAKLAEAALDVNDTPPEGATSQSLSAPPVTAKPKSPKKKKKQRLPEKEQLAMEASHEESSQSSAACEASPASPACTASTTTIPASTQSHTAPSDLQEKGNNISSSLAEASSEKDAASPSSPVVFDELGGTADEDFKPVKRKKKAKRDN